MVKADSGEPDGALADLTLALAEDPEYAEALLERGLLYLAEGVTGDARQDLEAFLDVGGTEVEWRRAQEALIQVR